ncbi:MAG TPA: hypothetical protein VLZ54_13125, partial [Arenibacter sp.]|nr:hypothetical protein [Arenibacter sp.]
MKTHLLRLWTLSCVLIFLTSYSIKAQVGIGTVTPDASSILDIHDPTGSKGLLIPKVALTATNVSAPISPTPATSLLVYNTNTAGSGNTAVSPGYYYWDSTRWFALDGTNGKDWSLLGNYGTNASTNFLGTLDANDLVFRTSNTERMRFAATGNAGINNVPYNNAKLNIESGNLDFGLFVISNSPNNDPNPNGASIYGGQTGYGDAVIGENVGAGVGVRGTANNYHGVYGASYYTTTGTGLVGGTVGWGRGESSASGVLALTNVPATTKSNIALRAFSGGTSSISSSEILNVAVNANAVDLGVYVLTEQNNGVREAARFQTNYAGDPLEADGRDPRAMLAGYAGDITIRPQSGGNISGHTYYGGYFYSGGVSTNASYAYAGARVGGSNYKIIGNGTVSTIVDGATENEGKKVMFAPEAPEVLFQDYGTGRLKNGMATISIDPIFANNIDVDTRPLKVFVQLEGNCNGVYVTNKSANGFTVIELNNGKSNVPFSWQIVANRKDDNARNGS